MFAERHRQQHASNISIMTGRGDTTFLYQLPEVDIHPANALVRGDLNDDGRPDLMAALQGCPPRPPARAWPLSQSRLDFPNNYRLALILSNDAYITH